MSEPSASSPRANLSLFDVTVMVVGIVIGIGIFKAPSLVAANVSSEAWFIGLWLLGGLVTLAGALCYAELGSAHPHAGGEYHFLWKAYGPPLGLLFAWARCAVIQPGAIAAVAFVLGDYANVLLPLGRYGPAIHALVAIAALTAVNFAGTRPGKQTQKLFETLTVLAVLGFIIAAFMSPVSAPTPPAPKDFSLGAAGFAMVFILLTYGGWNEAAYLSGELENVKRNMARALVAGVLVVVALYLSINLAYLRVLGLEGLRNSGAVGADVMRVIAGQSGAIILSAIVLVSALTTLNGTIFTGARSYYALGRDVQIFSRLGSWQGRGETPANALLTQGAISIVLVLFGAMARDGFEAMVAYTAPVFWLFMLLVAASLFIFRQRKSHAVSHYRVPFYPVPPLILCAACIWMLYSSLLYAGIGSIIGVAILLGGVPLLYLRRSPRMDLHE
jgi:APA family basic amino acid/polyamine antiporter